MSNEKVLDDLSRVIEQLEFVQIPIAKTILRATVADIPRPAFDTGALRRSGRAYVNGKFVSSTHRMREAQGSNPKTSGWDRSKLTADGELAEESPIQGISIIYKAPYSKKMHDYHGRFTDSESGPGFISAKLSTYSSIISSTLDRIFK